MKLDQLEGRIHTNVSGKEEILRAGRQTDGRTDLKTETKVRSYLINMYSLKSKNPLKSRRHIKCFEAFVAAIHFSPVPPIRQSSVQISECELISSSLIKEGIRNFSAGGNIDETVCSLIILR